MFHQIQRKQERAFNEHCVPADISLVYKVLQVIIISENTILVEKYNSRHLFDSFIEFIFHKSL